VDKVTGPLSPLRAIAAALKQLREERGKLLSDVHQDLGISTSKLSRLENAQGKPNPRDLADLIRYYRIEGTPLAERLEGWLEAAQQTGWWTDYEDVVAGSLDTHLAYEVDAVVARVYTIPFIPALLQTIDYARAVFRDMENRPEREIQPLLEIRLRRQEALRRREGLKPLRLVAVTHETALRQVVGSPGIMREQLDALIERSAAPNVDLHVMPFTAKPTWSMTCMYAYFQYGGSGESDIVHIETHAGFFSLGDDDHVRKYRAAHASLVRASLDKKRSLDLIRAIRDEMAGISLPQLVPERGTPLVPGCSLTSKNSRAPQQSLLSGNCGAPSPLRVANCER
jgi:transcriptional regulator with XRE-family HTH domain